MRLVTLCLHSVAGPNLLADQWKPVQRLTLVQGPHVSSPAVAHARNAERRVAGPAIKRDSHGFPNQLCQETTGSWDGVAGGRGGPCAHVSLQGVILLIRKHSSSSRLEDVPLATGSEEKAGWGVGERDVGVPLPHRYFFHLCNKALATTTNEFLAIVLSHLHVLTFYSS